MHEHFDGGAAYAHVRSLSELRRLPGTPGEGRARDYIIEAARLEGLEMESEEFDYSSAPLTVVLPLICFALSALCLSGSLAYLAGSPFTAVVGGVLAALVLLGLKWSRGFETFAARGGPRRSANLVGTLPADEPRGLVMLSAHYDSKSQVFPVVLRAAFFIAGFGGAALLGIALLAVGVMKAAGVDATGSRAGFCVSLLPAVLLLALVFNHTGNRSPGALDNASGVAIILELARVLAREPLGHLEVRVVAFGCEEMGLCGSINYLEAHAGRLRARPFYMLNFDMPFSSSGTLGINTGFEVPVRRTSEKLNRLAREAAEQMGFEVRGISLPVGAAADHMPWTRHGFEATGFVSASTRVHRPADSADRVDREGLRRAGEVALSIVRRLDQEASGSS